MAELKEKCYVESEKYSERTVAFHPRLSALTDEVDMDDYICQSVLPPALVYELLREEQPEVASACYEDYERALTAAKASLPAAQTDIEDCYGGLEYGRFSRW